MQAESLDECARRVLERWRQRREAATRVAYAPDAAAAAAAVSLMAIQRVVPDDPVRGPHLLAVPVALEGAPPVVRLLEGPVILCYPVPGRQVGDYAGGEVVKVYSGSGAAVAEKVV